MKRLDADKFHVGDAVFATVQLGWKDASCELRPGTILQGRVVFEKSYSKTSKTSEVGILFDQGQCGGTAMKPLALTVAAIVAAEYSRDPTLEENQSLSDAVGVTLQGNSRSLSQAAGTVNNEAGRTSSLLVRPPKEVKTGQVVGISHLKLLVGTGPEGSSILSSTRRDLRLDAGTQLVLVPDTAVAVGGGQRKEASPVPTQPAEAQSDPAPPNIADET